MNNDELLIAIQDMFEKKVEEVKLHTGVLFEDLRGEIKAIAEGHGLLNDKMDGLENRFDRLETKVDRLEVKFDALDSKVNKLEIKVDKLDIELAVVKDYVIGVDEKLNEHELVLKRVK